MKLKHTIETKIVVDYLDLEQLIEEVYGHEYDIVNMEEWGNEQMHNYPIRKQGIDEYDAKYINSLREGEPKQYSLYILVTDMCNNGHIDEGDYLINVSW